MLCSKTVGGVGSHGGGGGLVGSPGGGGLELFAEVNGGLHSSTNSNHSR